MVAVTSSGSEKNHVAIYLFFCFKTNNAKMRILIEPMSSQPALAIGKL